jgi:hypothetical protein
VVITRSRGIVNKGLHVGQERLHPEKSDARVSETVVEVEM